MPCRCYYKLRNYSSSSKYVLSAGSCLGGCDFVSLGEYFPTFRRIVLSPISGSSCQRRTDVWKDMMCCGAVDGEKAEWVASQWVWLWHSSERYVLTAGMGVRWSYIADGVEAMRVYVGPSKCREITSQGQDVSNSDTWIFIDTAVRSSKLAIRSARPFSIVVI